MIALILLLAAAAAPGAKGAQSVPLILCPPVSEPQPAACLEEPSASPFPPIEVPYQATEAFGVYRGCVLDRFDVAMRSVRNADEARQAHFDSVAACRDVRSVQLARALVSVTDRRVYGSRAKAQALARLAFDRFDREFDIAWATPAPSQQLTGGGANQERSN